MRSLLALLLLLGVTMNLPADPIVYVSLGSEKKIRSYRLDPRDGGLSAVETVEVEGTPGALTLDPQQRFLFATLRSTDTLASFRIDPATGKLKQLSTATLGKGENAAFLATDRTGHWLVSASYAGGKVVVHAINDDGTLRSPAVQTVETAKTAHSALFDRDNRFVFVPHVVPNAIYQFRLGADGHLTEVGKTPGGAANAGPRHIAWHPTRNLVFTSNELDNTVTAYLYDPATGLKPVQSLSTLPEGFTDKNTTAEVKVHPEGRFVWVSNRGHDSLASFTLDDAGKLAPLERVATEKTPRSFDLDPTGRFLLVGGEGSGRLAVYRVDPGTGKLSLLHTVDAGKSVTWVKVVELGRK